MATIVCPEQAELQQRILPDRATRSLSLCLALSTPKPKAVPQRVMCKIKFANATKIRDQTGRDQAGSQEGGMQGGQSNRATHAQHQFDKLISAIIDAEAGIEPGWLSCWMHSLSWGREFLSAAGTD